MSDPTEAADPYADPYTELLVAANALSFYGSAELAQKILTCISVSPPQSRLLQGLPGMGKSTLLRYLVESIREKRPWVEPVHTIDMLFPLLVAFRSLPGKMHPFVYLHQRFCDEYAQWQPKKEWPQRRMEGGQPDSQDAAITALEQEIEYLAGQGVRLAFLLDDFDLALKGLKKGELERLRPWSQSGLAAFILVVERAPSLVNAEAAGSPFLQLMLRERLGGLPIEEAERLLAEPASQAKPPHPFPPADLQHVLRQVGPHPYLLIRAGTTLGHLRKDLGLLDQHTTPLSERQRAMLDGHLQVRCQRAFELYWEHLEANERAALTKLVMPTDRRASDTLQDQAAWASLRDLGLVRQIAKEASYEFCSPLFRAFVESHSDTPPVALEQRLTGLEAQLYQYLRRNAPRLCTFEELSAHVWQRPLQADDAKQRRQIQVTVSRLRKTLEQSSGESIQSIRQQGYRWLAAPDL